MKKTILIFIFGLMGFFGMCQVPTISTSATVTVGSLTTTAGYVVTSQGGSAMTKMGLIWGTSPTLTYSPIMSEVNTRTPAVTTVTNEWMSPLLPQTTYYYRAFAINASGIAYGNVLSFTTTSRTPKKWYWSTSGNDANNGTTPTTPKKTLKHLQDLVCCGNTTFGPGDTIFFKRGDLFDNGYTLANGFDFASCSYRNRPEEDYTAGGGTESQPIVFTSYGDTTKPLANFVYPKSTPPVVGSSERHYVLVFGGVRHVIVDGLQFNDIRFPYADKATPAYTRGSVLMGQYTNTKVNGTDTTWGTNRDDGDRRESVFNFTLKNCIFSNTSFGLASVSAFDSKITNNVFTNFKSTKDTFGINDVLAGAIEALNGKRLEISNNYIKGAWSKSGRNSSTQGMGGIALDIFNFQDSKIIYNTIVDCSGFMEAGGLDLNDVLSGMYRDTIAFNKVLNCAEFLTTHTACGDPFLALQYNIRIWNNVIVENDFSRFSGNNFGSDLYGDGQSFKWWFWGANFLTTGYNNPTGTFTNGSNQITGLSTMSGIQVGSTVYGPERANPQFFPGGPQDYATVTALGANSITIDKTPIRTGTVEFLVFPPLSTKGIRWSQPNNPSSNGWYGTFDNNSVNERIFMQGSSSFCYGSQYDTLLDVRNNIMWGTTGLQIVYPDNTRKTFRNNNIFYVNGGFSHTFTDGGTSFNNVSRLGDGATLRTSERLYTGSQQIFKNTTSPNPELWDFHLADGTYGTTNGIITPGINKDFAGAIYTGAPSIGIYNFMLKPQASIVTQTNPCKNAPTTGAFTINGSGGTAPYTYKVNTSTFTTTTTYTGLTAGTYMVTIRDSKGLTSTLNVILKSITCP